MRKRLLTRFAPALARRLVRGYPQPWRDRYEGELLALLEDSHARLRDVVDLTRGLLVERARAFFEPGDRPWLTYFLSQLKSHALAVGAMGVTVMAGWVAGYWLGPVPRVVVLIADVFNLFASAIFVIRLGVRMGASPQRTFPGPPLPPAFAKRPGFVWVGTVLAVTFVSSWGSPGDVDSLVVMNVTLLAFQMSSPHAWQLVVWRAVHRLWTVRHELKWAVMELERCERLVAKGHMFMSGPLDEARDTVARINRERDEAMATLHSLGYRATLQRGSVGPPIPEP